MEMKGLHKFIEEFLNESKGNHLESVATEITKIKKVFTSKKVKNYDIRKSVAKLCFISLMGYEVSFGVTQIIDLFKTSSLTDKRIGSMAAVMACPVIPELYNLLIPELKKLLTDQQENNVILALVIASSIDTSVVADSLGPTIADIAINNSTSHQVRKRALFCLSRIYKSSQQLPVVDKVAPRVGSFLRSHDLGVALNCSWLALSLAHTQITAVESSFHVAIDILKKLIVDKQCPNDYMLNGFPCPYLCANLFKLLTYKVSWEANEVKRINNVVVALLDKSDEYEKNNGITISFLYVFSEASLTCTLLQLPNETIERFIHALTKYLKHAVFAIEALTNIIQTSPKYTEELQPQINTLLHLVKSGRSIFDTKALNLLFYISNKENYEKIILDLLPFVSVCPLRMRADLCLKIGVLTQSFSPNSEWKSKTLMELAEKCPSECNLIWNYVADAILEDDKNLKENSSKMLSKVEGNQRLTTGIMKIAAYIIGIECPAEPSHVSSVLIHHFNTSEASSQAAIISCLHKLAMKYPDIKEDVISFLDKTISSPYVDVSQRSREARMILIDNKLSSAVLTAPRVYIDTTINFDQKKFRVDSDPISQFFNRSDGIIFSRDDIEVHATITKIIRSRAKVTIVFRVQNNTENDISITMFEIESGKNVISKIIDKVEAKVEAKKYVNFTVQFIATDVFSELPTAVIGFDSIPEANITIPLLPKYFMESYDVTKDRFTQIWKHTKSPGQFESVQLILPDGNVLDEVDKTVRKWTNIRPLTVEGTPNSLFMSGSFATFKAQVGIVMRFVYDEDEMMLKLDIHSTSLTATNELVKIARKAFPQYETEVFIRSLENN